MNLNEFLAKTNLDNSLLIGYYGGGNYGDELLLETLGNLLTRQGVQGVTVTYQRPETYPAMHHDFGFKVIDIYSRPAVTLAALKSRNILIGGGGLWGVDMNFNTLLLSIFLFVSRWVLRKKVCLLGVGYYNSTSGLGRLGAWLAGKAANTIIARDAETAQNFGKITKHVQLDADIAWHVQELNLDAYKNEVAAMQEHFPVGAKTLLVALRRPQANKQSNDFVRFNKLTEWLVKSNPTRPIIMIMPEAEAKDDGIYKLARQLRRHHKHLRIIEAPYNPLALFLFVQQNRKHLALVAPQLHLIMTAHLTGVPFLPIVYDNKVSALLEQVDFPTEAQLPLKQLGGSDLLAFASNFYGVKE